eukprot:m.564869 g.564869  ORF g.564869 m.564869 type:complete len:553 (-) comp22237_c0_seq2:323-1981(-)
MTGVWEYVRDFEKNKPSLVAYLRACRDTLGCFGCMTIMENISSFLRTGKIRSKKNNRCDLPTFLADGVRVSNPSKVLSLMKRHGVSTLAEFMVLGATEKEELISELRAGGINLGDRSKLNRTTAESITAWIDCQVSQSAGSSPSKKIGPHDTLADIPSPTTNDNAKVAEKVAESGGPAATRIVSPNQLVGTLKGAPAWWNEHDKRIRQIARKVHLKDVVDTSASPTVSTYPWKRHDGCEWEAYQAVLWQRRAELLAMGDFARNSERRSEWLALVLELDATAGGDPERNSSGDRPQMEDYSWYTREDLNDDVGKRNAYVKVLLERRSKMLTLNLTKKKSLQTEWVLLMRELDTALQANVNVTKAQRKQKQKEQVAKNQHGDVIGRDATTDVADTHAVTTAGSGDGDATLPTAGSVDDSGVDTEGGCSGKEMSSAPSVRVTEESAPSQDGTSAEISGAPAHGADTAGRTKQRLTKANISAWRSEVASSISRPDSLCSLLTDNSELQRVASLASFYSDAANTDEFFTGDEADSDDDDDLGSCQSFSAAEEIAVAT